MRTRIWRRDWAVTPHERVRVLAILDSILACLYGLDWDDFSFVLRDCDHPLNSLSDRRMTRKLDSKGFWRIDKDKHPELRHPVLALIAFQDLQAMIDTHGGDRDAAISTFCKQNGGDGWTLPEAVSLADYGLGHDQRAKEHQPVAAVLGPRFLDWQLAQTPEESWAECERHAHTLGSDQLGRSATQTDDGSSKAKPPPQPQMALGFGEDER
jgi:hypothetical protein